MDHDMEYQEGNDDTSGGDDDEIGERELELTEAEEATYEDIFRGPKDEVLATRFNVDLTRDKMECLLGLDWLNDEVVNFYLNLMIDRVFAQKEDQELDHHRAYVNGCWGLVVDRL